MMIMMCSLNLFMTLSQALDPGDSNKEPGYYICTVPDGGEAAVSVRGSILLCEIICGAGSGK